jgi:hypothetical protein
VTPHQHTNSLCITENFVSFSLTQQIETTGKKSLTPNSIPKDYLISGFVCENNAYQTPNWITPQNTIHIKGLKEEFPRIGINEGLIQAAKNPQLPPQIITNFVEYPLEEGNGMNRKNDKEIDDGTNRPSILKHES